MALAQPDLQPRRAPSTMKKFASSRSLNKILAQCDSSSREYEEIQAVERRWHLHLATPRCLLLDRRSKASLFFAAPPPPKHLQCRSCRGCGFDPWVGKISGGGHGHPLQCSCLENPLGQRP